MRKITKPKEDSKTVFLNCITDFSDQDLKTRLEQIASLIATSSQQFDNLIRENKLCLIERNKVYKATKEERIFGGLVTINEVKEVYTKGFAAKDSPGRVLYDEIILSAPYSKCPYCFHRNVGTMDHYLPKAYYPLLSVVPFNLVPSCIRCNTGELRASFPQQPSEEILHPYYDDVEKELWLRAEVKHTSPATINFFADPPEKWDSLLKDRVRNHFSILKLNELYSIEAALELINLEGQCQAQYNMGGAAAVKSHLEETAESRKVAFINSWQTALYSAIAIDNWFHNGGFVIPKK
ncbi:HNH endonuclease [Taibaiella chishuiensis]|uniref:HNH endonuclease n=1 Tax=Taibaiella chishuiensis TaxID=1434707 RepID=A0A2P8D1E3_9BACT|nr:hypothetical protein [Taibaiella chishuiensis]PSK91043.1 hypothetical protein B0I18_10653 [Taibaiella chishuiensis]